MMAVPVFAFIVAACLIVMSWYHRRDHAAYLARAARITTRRDVYLSYEDMHTMARLYRASPDEADKVSDVQAEQRHLGWTTLEALAALTREGVVHLDPVAVSNCAGVWLRPSGAVLTVLTESDREHVLAEAVRAVEAGRRDSHVYLSRQDVCDLAHHNFYIPINRGYHVRYVERRYPGWTWEGIHGSLQNSGYLHRQSQSEVSPRHLPDGAVGVLIGRDGSVTLDDGSLEHSAKERSGDRLERPF